MAARLPYLDRAQVPPEVQSLTNRFDEALGTELEYEETRHG